MGLFISPCEPKMTRTGPVDGRLLGHHVVARVGRVLELGRQRDPQLESPHALWLGFARVPDAVACAHPLDAAGRQHTGLPRRLCVTDRALQDDGHRRDARVRVPAELHRQAWPPPVDVGSDRGTRRA